MKSYRSLILVALYIILQACISDGEFERSPFNDIKAFQLPGQAGVTSINSDDKTIIIPISEGTDLSSLVPSDIKISNLARITPGIDEAQDFSKPVIYSLTAENNSLARWTIYAVAALPNPQLDNSNFDSWYYVSDYQQPGLDSNNTVWGTANRAVAIVGDANTIPVDLGNGDFAAKLTSVAAPLIVRMAAATLFTGTFTSGFPSATDPRSNINFGIPFNGRPQTFTVDYKYIPGSSYEDADGNPVSGKDQCDIYVLLEKRDGDTIERIGTGWFRSSATVIDFSNLQVEIKYGVLTSSDPEITYANIRDGELWGDPQETPTHITVVFSSSALGDFFTGAIGSELWINNFELNY